MTPDVSHWATDVTVSWIASWTSRMSSTAKTGVNQPIIKSNSLKAQSNTQFDCCLSIAAFLLKRFDINLREYFVRSDAEGPKNHSISCVHVQPIYWKRSFWELLSKFKSNSDPEHLCPQRRLECIGGQFECGDGQCIYDFFACNGNPNCDNGKDETDCSG